MLLQIQNSQTCLQYSPISIYRLRINHSTTSNQQKTSLSTYIQDQKSCTGSQGTISLQPTYVYMYYQLPAHEAPYPCNHRKSNHNILTLKDFHLETLRACAAGLKCVGCICFTNWELQFMRSWGPISPFGF